jgi:hypothetical protein
MADESGGFLSRWARRKEQARTGVAPVAEPVLPVEAPPLPTPVVADLASPTPSDAQPVAEPLPTMADVALLTRESDYARFVSGDVDVGVKRAAMKKLFADPHFNVMDGLDTYIDDYGKPDPIPLAMLRQMNQSKLLGLFDTEEDEGLPAAQTPEPAPAIETTIPHDDPDLRLQQDDDAGRPGAGDRAGA